MSSPASSPDGARAAAEALRGLGSVLAEAPARLLAIPEARASERPGPGRWSRKEELGHLVDSALNNLQRIVRAQIEKRLSFPGYEQDAWVRLQRYGDRPWRDLIEVWRAANGHLEAAARAVEPEAWDRECIIGGAAPVTLAMLIQDYLRHLLHHLEHIGAAGARG